ncbi:hypothetical protein ACMFMG_004770 [Clarireedia jacksonii]
MPTYTYRTLMRSISTLCDKILRQPTSTQLYQSVENVRILLQGVQNTASKTHESVQEIQKTATSINTATDSISTATKTYASAAASRTSLPLPSRQHTLTSTTSSFMATQRTIRIRLHSQTTAEAFRTYTATRIKQNTIYKKLFERTRTQE